MAIGIAESSDRSDSRGPVIMATPRDCDSDTTVGGDAATDHMRFRRHVRCCLITGAASSLVSFALLAWLSGFPRVGPVPFAAACERLNSPGTFLAVFAFASVVSFLVTTVVDRSVGLFHPRSGRHTRKK